MHVIKTQEPMRVWGVYQGEQYVELYVNKGRSSYWITYKDNKEKKTIYGWDKRDDAEFEMEKILLKMEIKKGA